MSGTVTVTGGSGFLGQLIRPGLEARGWRVSVFDPYRGRLVDVVRRRRMLAPATPARRRAAAALCAAQRRAERALHRVGAITPSGDDILASRDEVTAAFAGSDAVLHLAGLPHPFVPGMTDADFQRINYDGSVNVFEAARAAGVRTFVFASSGQVYRINSPLRVEELPIPETAHLPLPAERQTTYGFLKAAFERTMAGTCAADGMQGVALRLEYPGFRSRIPENLYISTSVENLVDGIACALRPPADLAFETFNIADAVVDPAIVDIQDYVARRWPYARNRTAGNACLLSTERAQRVLGYRPAPGGTYVDPSLLG